MYNLGRILDKEGHYGEAEKLLRETLDLQRHVLGGDHPNTLTTMNGLADVLNKETKYDEAEKVQQETRDIQRRVMGPEHPETAISTYNLGCIALHKGKRVEALRLLREAIDHGLPAKLAVEMDKDSDLALLHGDPGFDALVAHAKDRAAAAEKKQ